ncbi:MAG: NUDIX hydrolase [Archangium sp.]|nr:NUDIX hydrolase [Archangium sp.]
MADPADNDPVPRPWTRVAVRAERDYRIFRTRTLDVLDPRNGTPYVRTVIDAPDWVNVIPVTEAGEVVLVRQFRFGTWSNTLEIPGGMLDPGEDALTAAGRELEEETGFRPGRVSALGISHPNPAILVNRLHSFLAEGCVKVHAGKQDGSEDIQVVIVPRADLPGLVRAGTITHSLVLAALLYDAWRPGA